MDNLNDRYIRHFLAAELGKMSGSRVEKLLDLGCGDLRYKPLYEDVADIVVGMDIEVRSPAVSVLGSATSLPFRDEIFDVVVSSEVIEHVADQRAVFAEVARVMKPGGVFLLTFPFMYGLHEEPDDYARPTEFAIKAWLRETPLTCERFLRRGGAVAVMYTIVTSFLFGAVTGVFRSKKAFGPLVNAVSRVLSGLHAIAFRLCLLASPGELKIIGSGLTGVGGQLAHWPLGYCFVFRRQRKSPES